MIQTAKKVIVENQYLGCIHYFAGLVDCEQILLEYQENWQKMSYRNRCIITGSNGLINLTVPVVKGRDQKEIYRDVRINNNDQWRKQHWRSIFSCYGKAPFFEYYKDALEAFYEQDFEFLFDMNLQLFMWILKMLKIKATIILTESYNNTYSEETQDYRNLWQPRQQSNLPFTIPYIQVFQDRTGFQPNLSILDLLMNTGPEAIHILRRKD